MSISVKGLNNGEVLVAIDGHDYLPISNTNTLLRLMDKIRDLSPEDYKDLADLVKQEDWQYALGKDKPNACYTI